LSVLDEGYSRNASCALKITKIYVFGAKIQMSLTVSIIYMYMQTLMANEIAT